MLETQAHLLLVNGLFLFILGLVNGFVIPFFTNSRMGLSAHLAGVQNGMVLLIFGLLWPKISLSDSMLQITFWLSLFSMYAIWFGLMLAAIWGTSRSTPIAGKGFRASKMKEQIVRFIIVIASVAILIASIALLFGLL